MNGLVYLATPYTHPNPDIRELRFIAAERCAAALMKRGYHIFSPIVHCHGLAKKYSMPTDYLFWLTYNTAFLRAAEAVFVLKMPGWEESKGVVKELELVKELGKLLAFVEFTPEYPIEFA